MLCRYGMVVLDEVGNTSEGDLDTVLKLRLKEAVRWGASSHGVL